MKIAIVCGHFIPNMGYFEVHLANTYTKLGHDVTVITSSVVPSYVKKQGKTNDTNTPYKVTRLHPYFSLGQMVKAKGLIQEIESFAPDLVISIGVGKLFNDPLYKIKSRAFKLATLLGDNEETYVSKGIIKSIKNSILKNVVKKQSYELAIKNSDVIFPYTPSTIDITKEFLKNNTIDILNQKAHAISLGFDDSVFYYDTEERLSTRKKLNVLEDEILIITNTRVVSEKKLEVLVDHIHNLMLSNNKIKYLMVGFLNDDYGKKLQSNIKTLELSENFIIQPFCTAEESRAYYNASDIAIYTRAAISIFEALGTGLFVFLPDQKNVSSILQPSTGNYYHQVQNITFNDIDTIKANRKSRSNINTCFNYGSIANKILEYCEL